MPEITVDLLRPGDSEAKTILKKALPPGAMDSEFVLDWTALKIEGLASAKFRANFDRSNGGFVVVFCAGGRQLADAVGYVAKGMSIGFGVRAGSCYLGFVLDTANSRAQG